MDDRAEFEQWAAERYEGQFRRNLDGDYCNVRLCEGWETWQAATARQRERDARKMEFVNRLLAEAYGEFAQMAGAEANDTRWMLEYQLFMLNQEIVPARGLSRGELREAIRRQP